MKNENKEEKNKWHKIDISYVPKDNEAVICWLNNGNKQEPSICYYSVLKNRFYHNLLHVDLTDIVTHWTHLTLPVDICIAEAINYRPEY